MATMEGSQAYIKAAVSQVLELESFSGRRSCTWAFRRGRRASTSKAGTDDLGWAGKRAYRIDNGRD